MFYFDKALYLICYITGGPGQGKFSYFLTKLISLHIRMYQPAKNCFEIALQFHFPQHQRSIFFDQCFRGAGSNGAAAEVDGACAAATIERFCGENDLALPGVPAETWGNAKTAAEAFAGLLDSAANEAAGVGWVEKTPDHLKRLDLIEAACPDAAVVHIVRSPGPTIASLQRASKAWGKPRGWFAFAVKWWLSARLSRGCIGRARHHHVFYEDVIEDTEGECRRLFAALDLRWDDGVMARYRQTAESVIAPGESWKAANVGQISPGAAQAPVRNPLKRAVLAVLNRSYRNLKSDAA